MPQIYDIIWPLIEKWEGVRKSVYVPTDQNGNVLGQSGPTIGTGVDLGQWTPQQLSAIGVPADVVDKLKSYCGRQGQDALDFVASHPLTLGDDERVALDRAVQKSIADKLADAYDTALFNYDQAKRFTQLPREIQTVLYSVGHQYGPNVSARCPRFWALATKQKWTELISELRNFGDDYGSRRNQEADTLAPLVGATPGMDLNNGHYSGQTVDGRPCGDGQLNCNDGRVYQGPFAQGIPFGVGKLTYPNGDSFDGFVWGDQCGDGVYKYADGKLLKGGDPHWYYGPATIVYPDGRVYEGGTARGYTRGHGRMTYPDGHVEEGEWADSGNMYAPTPPSNEPNPTADYSGPFIPGIVKGEDGSRGVIRYKLSGEPFFADLFWPDGPRTYKGGWSNDNEAQGFGLCTDDGMGLRYEGAFQGGKFNGSGKMDVPGGHFEGDFQDGLPDGNGKYTGQNGTQASGEWKAGKLNGQGEQIDSTGRYRGQFVDGQRHGQGEWHSVDGKTSYKGAFVNGSVTGTGTYQDESETYTGEFSSGRYNGQGTLETHDGYRLQGNFQDGVFRSGTVTFPDHSRFEGTVNDKGELVAGERYDAQGNHVETIGGDHGHDHEHPDHEGVSGHGTADKADKQEHPRPGELCHVRSDGDWCCHGHVTEGY